jgi:hypothetical protein
MRPVKDPIHGWVLVEDYIADLVEMEQRNRGFGIGASDRQAFSRIHSGLSPSAEVVPVGAPVVKTVGDPVAKPSGWSDPLPLKPPPGIDLVDRLALDRARERIASAQIIPLKAIQHNASELKPSPARSPGANGNGGFRRRF